MKYTDALHYARESRKNPTQAEKFLWEKLANRNFYKLKFHRQYIFRYKILNTTSRFFIFDFYCHQLKLAVEVDGGYHKLQKDYDKYRDQIINGYGINIIHFKNEEVLNNWKNTSRILFEICFK